MTAVRTVVAAAVLVALVSAAASQARLSATTPRLQLVAKGVSQALYVTAPRDERDRVYVVQKHGVVRVIQAGRLLTRPFLRLQGVDTRREMGLLSIAFDPAYSRNGYVYAFYNGDDGAVNVVRLTARAGVADPGSARVLVRVPHADSPFHNGGQLLFGPDGKLYVGVGDGGYTSDGVGPLTPDPQGNSQNLQVLLGKVFRLDPHAADPVPELVAYGLRNPWRFSFTPGGDLVVGDVGYDRTEEVDVVPRGATLPLNFGWSVYEGRRRRTTDVQLDPTGKLTFPALTYATGVQDNCSIVGGFVYSGRRVPALRGRYVFGDYCSGRVWTARVAGATVADRRTLPVRVPQLVSFGTDAAGELYAVSLGGRVYRLVR